MGSTRGEYTNNVLTLYDSVMSPPRGTSPAEAFPTQVMDDMGAGTWHRDDFEYNTSTSYWQVVKGTGGSITLSSSLSNGWINIPTAASSNDYQCLFTQEPLFTIPAASGNLLFWEAYFNVTEANTNKASWFAGFTSTTTTGFLTNSGVPPSSYSGAVIYKTENTLNLNAQTSNSTTQNTTSSAITTVVSGTSYIVGMAINSNDGTTAICTYYVSKVASNVRTFVTSGTLNLTIASLSNMYFGFGVRAASSSAETLTADYVQFGGPRYYN